jgi:hypothetical protein
MIEQPSLLLMLALSFLSILLAYISLHFIEKPFRNIYLFSRKKVFALSLIALFTLCFLGVIGVKKNGFDGRFADSELLFLNQINEENNDYVVKKFNSLKSAVWDTRKKKVFLIGDSYAQDLTNAVYESDIIKSVSLSTWHISAQCGNLYIPFKEKIKFIAQIDLSRCASSDYFENEDFIKRLKDADEVWFASSWTPWQIELIQSSLANVENLTFAVIRVFGRKDLPLFKHRKYSGLSSKERAIFVEPISTKKMEVNLKLSYLANDYNFIDVQGLICGEISSECKIFDELGYLKSYDGGHLTKKGAQFLGGKLSEKFGKL